MRHTPTGIEAKSATKSQHRNRVMAREVLEARVRHHYALIAVEADAERRTARGSGMRGDKVRTYRAQDDVVTDHRSGQKVSLRSVSKGDLSQLL